MNATSSGLDPARIRADFPILDLQVNGKPLVYLDNAASAQMPQRVMCTTARPGPTCGSGTSTSSKRR